MSEIVYPHGYGTTLVTIDELFRRNHVEKMHPEYARRLRRWLIDQRGHIGIGGSWRDTGAQPDKPGFAPEGKSFHQYQRFASGIVAFAAVDLVARNPGGIHRSPNWSEVPAQGSDWAKKYGVHANVSSESWHLQAIEIDGFDSWKNAGSPDPTTNYPILGETGELDMKIVNPPIRVLDTRTAAKVSAGGEVVVKIPTVGATAAFVNITVTQADAQGYVTAWSGVGPKPNVSNVNFVAGETECNGSWVPLSGGSFKVFAKSGCHLIVDLQATA